MSGSEKRGTVADESPELAKFLVVVQTVGGVLSDLIKWGALLGIAAFTYMSVHDLAGKNTVADINASANFGAKVELPQETGNPRPADAKNGGDATAFLRLEGCPTWWLVLGGFLLGVGGIGYGLVQRRIRRDAIERMHDFQKKYETTVDPNRTSSNLTKRGDTRPEDR